MGKEKFKNLFLILIVILIVISIPYLLYTLGTLIEIDYFGYINNWWIVLLFIIVLISVFVLVGINLEKKMAHFFLTLFSVSFFILGIRFGVKPLLNMESYTLLLDKEQEIDRLDSALLKLEDKSFQGQVSQSSDFKNHEIIFFKPGSSELSDFNKLRITAFVSTLDNCKLNVNGYTDGSGNRSSNMDISNERAQNVADFIKSISQQNNTINAVAGFGDDYQLVENRDDVSRSKNRRVTIEIVGGIDAAEKARRERIQDEINRNRENIKNIKVERDSLRKVIYPEIEE